MISKSAQDELASLAKRLTDPLHPYDVVKWARKNTTSALHECFEWDDGKAADRYRIDQARHFIRMIVITPAGTGVPMRALVSITKDRLNGGGYRHIGDVMEDGLMANQIILEALREAKRWSFKYQHLQQLRDIHKAVERVVGRLEPKLIVNDENGQEKRSARAAA